MILFRPVGLQELQLIRRAAFRAFPPRLPNQPIFYPVLSAEYARMIARDWNTTDPLSGFAGFVTRFEVQSDWVARYPVRAAGGRDIDELWVPAEELDAFNAHIIGPIEVTEAYTGPQFHGTLDPMTLLPSPLL